MGQNGFTPTLKLILDSLLDTTELVTYKVDGTPNATTLILRFRPKSIKHEDEDNRDKFNTTALETNDSKSLRMKAFGA